MRKYVRRKEAAAYLGIAEQTLSRWAVVGFGPSMHKMGRAVSYSIEELDRFAEARRVRSTSEHPRNGEGDAPKT
jgi:predicted site-specific integrase-resolvase